MLKALGLLSSKESCPFSSSYLFYLQRIFICLPDTSRLTTVHARVVPTVEYRTDAVTCASTAFLRPPPRAPRTLTARLSCTPGWLLYQSRMRPTFTWMALAPAWGRCGDGGECGAGSRLSSVARQGAAVKRYPWPTFHVCVRLVLSMCAAQGASGRSKHTV